MEIKFTEDSSTDENSNVDRKSNTNNKKTKKPKDWLHWFSVFTFVIAIIFTLYEVSFCASPVLSLLLSGFFFFLWFCEVLIVTVFTVGLIWLNEGYRTFNDNFLSFCGSLATLNEQLVDFYISAFWVCSGAGGLFLGTTLFLNIRGYKTCENKIKGYKGRMISSIILLVLFITFFIIDIIFKPSI